MIVLNEHWINMEYWWILNLYKIYKIHKSSFRICEYYNYIQLADVKTSGFVAEQGRAVFRSLEIMVSKGESSPNGRSIQVSEIL